MRKLLTMVLCFSLLSIVFPQDISSLIIEIPKSFENQCKETKECVLLQCTSWRFAVESNNLGPWSTIPEECADYIKDYINGRGYQMDLERVSNESLAYAKNIRLNQDGKDAWVFDVDETLLFNLPYYMGHGYGKNRNYVPYFRLFDGPRRRTRKTIPKFIPNLHRITRLEIFDSMEFDKWVETGMAPSVRPSLKLYEELLKLGFKVFLLTGRSERHRDITVKNLINAGFHDWDKLILRSLEDHGKLATMYKSEKRSEMVNKGYRILGNSGDQWSDLLGSAMSVRSFKLPNPMYYIP